MRPTDYILDRLPLLLGFVAALFFLLLVVHLGVAPLALADAAYILLLGGVAAGLILFVDYQRQRGFRQSVLRRLESEAGEESGAAPLPPAKSRELRAMSELLTASQRQSLAALQLHRRGAEEHRAFVDLWVHQMKTPLAVLELTAQQQEEDSEAWRSVAEEVDAIGHGLELMLTSARLERFELDLKPDQVDLVTLARSSVNDLKASWIRHGVYPSVDAPTGSVMVETDPKWLAVVLRQLLTNAIKYGKDGQRVRVVVREQTGGASIAVADEGLGIPPEDVPRIFDRFFTGTNGRLTQASTGMGLYLAAEICRRLGHELSVDTAVGEGSTFTVKLSPKGLHRLSG